MSAHPHPKPSGLMMRLMARMMPSCRDITALVSESMDRKLPLRQRMSIRMHLAMCRLCRRYAKQLTLLRQGLRRYAEPDTNPAEPSLSPEAAERLKKALQERQG